MKGIKLILLLATLVTNPALYIVTPYLEGRGIIATGYWQEPIFFLLTAVGLPLTSGYLLFRQWQSKAKVVLALLL